MNETNYELHTKLDARLFTSLAFEDADTRRAPELDVEIPANPLREPSHPWDDDGEADTDVRDVFDLLFI